VYLRLRQLCLVASQLEPVVQQFSAVLGLAVCHRDPAVAQFGLHNALLPVGHSFLEVVAPLREGTAAGRYLQRRGGDGGYMVILDTDDLPHWRQHVAQIGVRVAAHLAMDDYEGAQLHPQDTGGALLEINSTRGGADLQGPYWPAGPHWQAAVRNDRVSGIAGVVLQSDEPERLAQRWALILQRSAQRDGDEWLLPVGKALLRFTQATDGRGEGLAGIDLIVNDADALQCAAQAAGCTVQADVVHIGGVRFGLQAALFTGSSGA
jgi:hypothetical protein